jgi:hypothetical protein
MGIVRVFWFRFLAYLVICGLVSYMWQRYNPDAQLTAIVTTVGFILAVLTIEGLVHKGWLRRWFGIRIVMCLIVCAVVGCIWMRNSPEGRHAEIATIMLTFFLTFLAIDLAIEHKGLLGKVNELILDVYGLANYISDAAGIYQLPSKRVVTSLHHWVSTGKSGDEIRAGIMNSKAEELVFLGEVAWNHFFPGVLWRLVTVRESLHGAAADGIPRRAMIWHVRETVPVFVVSRPASPTADDKGNLLVANPMSGSSTRLYGIKYGRKSPTLVDFYNFLYDAYVCPSPEVKQQLDTMEFNATSGLYAHLTVDPPQAKDGLEAVFGIAEFTTPLLHRHTVRAKDMETAQECVAEEVVKELTRKFHDLLEIPRKADGNEFIMPDHEITNACREFIQALRESDILIFNGDCVTGKFDRNPDKQANCSTFFAPVDASARKQSS